MGRALMNSVRDFVRDNLDSPFLNGLLAGAPDWVILGISIVLLLATLGSILLLLSNAARGFQFLVLAARNPVEAVERVVNPGKQRDDIEALKLQLSRLETQIDAMNRPWIRVPDVVSGAFEGLAGFASGLLSAGRFAELRKRMDGVLAKFPESNWARRTWIDATQGLADEAVQHGQYLLAASRYREAIKHAESLLREG